jgi:hypothetical protein
MGLLDIDEAKHPHPRRYRRARSLLVVGILFGILLTVLGLAFSSYGYDGTRAWLVTLTIIGPSVIFLSAVGFATYLEGLEKETYGRAYEGEESPRQAEGFQQVP